MIKALVILLFVCGATYLGMLLFVFLTQKSMVYMPGKSLSATPEDVGLPFEDVRFNSGRGTELHGWHVPNAGSRRVVLFCHGNAGSISHRLETVLLLHAMGINVFLFDYSGFGESHGAPSEAATEADAQAAWNWLIERGYNVGDIIVHGRSLGGAIAASLVYELSAAGTQPAGLVLESTFTSIVAMGKRHYPWLPVSLLSRYRYDTVMKLPNLHLPILILHSRDDEIVPYEHGQSLYNSSPKGSEFMEIHGGHNRGFLESGPLYHDILTSWFDRVASEKSDHA